MDVSDPGAVGGPGRGVVVTLVGIIGSETFGVMLTASLVAGLVSIT
ncbi:MAG: hypothetical protein M3Q60_23220 [Actinomycetota bacterium]|nr:hypothetical protein [Actinomycetota bacterium]